MTARKPCFECNYSDQDNMSIGECPESLLCTVKRTCWHIRSAGHWEDCGFGARSEEYPAFLAKQNMAQCPCCKGSGFIPKEGSIIDEIRALEWRGPGTFSCCPWCGGFEVHGHESDCKLVPILRRLK